MKEAILALAKAAILAALGQPVHIDLEKLLAQYPALKEKGAAFVTINKGAQHRLRGCIGSLQAFRPLYEDIIHNAKAAALEDPRFHPLRPEELGDITVEVSVLSEPKPLAYKNVEDLKQKIRPGIDGVVLRLGSRRATYLPQVWEQLPDFESFFSSLCQKAGLPGNCLASHPQIEVYQVTKYSE